MPTDPAQEPEIEGRTSLEGDFLDTVIGIPDAHTEIVLLRAPDGGAGLELARFIRPDHEPGSAAAMATELGLRSVAFEVDDPQVIVERARGGWLRPGRRHRRVRARLAHGLLARARGDRRLPR